MPVVPELTGPAVEGRDLVLAYGERIALRQSSFTVPADRVTAVIGPNGAGKSTLLGAVAGLVEPAAGQLRVLGRSPREARRRVAYVLQATRVNEAMPLTVREAVAMGRYASLGLLRRFGPADRRVVDEVLERLDIARLGHLHLRELSGGQRQRVFVAQGLVQERRLLLLDEPLTGLDLVSRQRILEVIDEEHQAGRAVVFTTHDLGEARLADHVLLLSGRVVAEGPPERALHPDRLGEAYGAQVVEIGDASLVVDDPAHLPAHSRHVHLDRGEGTRPLRRRR